MAGIWSQADIDALKVAIRSGLLTVSFSGPPSRTVTYQSLEAMRSLLASMVQDVNGQNGTASYGFFSTNKGTWGNGCH